METVSQGDKLSFLRQPSSYSASGQEVTVRETHTSWVFLVGDDVYKMKKPIKLPALDFRSLGARERNCLEELRLNRRLAGDIYRDVVPLRQKADGSICLGGEGIVIDWLVKMRRLPENRMLDVLLSRNKLGRAQLDSLGSVLARFYAAAEKPAVQPRDVLESFRAQHALNLQILAQPQYDIDHVVIGSVVTKIGDLLAHLQEIIARRVSNGRYVEGHGDLRPEHICSSIASNSAEHCGSSTLSTKSLSLTWNALFSGRLGLDQSYGEGLLNSWMATYPTSSTASMRLSGR